MISKVLAWMLTRKLDKLHFPHQQGPHASKTTQEVLHAFKLGAIAAVENQPEKVVQEREQQLPWNRYPFFWEGHAFGTSAKHAFSFSSGNPDRRCVTRNYRYMYYTGLGFWNGVASRQFMPRVSLAPERWSEVEDWAFRGPMLAGGDSFVHVCERGDYNPADLKRVTIPPGEDWRHLALFGAGRALWFVYMANPKRIEQVFDAHPGDASWIASGVGLAMTYTQIGTPERILPALASISPRYSADLVRGSIVGLYGWGEDDPRSHEHLSKLPSPLPDWWQVGQETMGELPQDGRWHQKLEEHGLERVRAIVERDLTPICQA